MNKQEVFIVENQEKIALFAPFKGLILEINNDEKDKIEKLLECSIFSFRDLLKMFPEIDKNRFLSFKTEDEPKGKMEEFCPTSVVLFTTFNCQLRCIYCYSKAGEEKMDMDWEIAKAAIDFIIENAKRSEKKECSLEFHGGGEPTLNWSIFQSSLNYFQKHVQENGLVSKINLVTNGMLSKKQINWIAEHGIKIVQVSLDGMEEIQNFQRPTSNGGKSFEIVYRTIKSFLAKGIEITIHSVVTEKGVKRIPEIVRFFGHNFPRTTVQIEPNCPCGRGLTTCQQFPSAEIFAKGFIEALEIAKSFGIELIYSGASSQLTEIHRSFCGVSTPNFVITPAGFVTACHEVAEFNHLFADFFIYGQLDRVKEKFIFDHQKIEKLRACVADPMCNKCFALPYCAGDCLVKNLNDISKKGTLSLDSRCRINRELTKYYIFNHLFGGKGGAL